MKGITELQAGTYLLMDTAFREKGVTDFDCALSVLGTVISRPSWPGAENLAIIDVGREAIDNYFGLPSVKHLAGATLFSMPQEHGRLRLDGSAKDLKNGDKVELWVRDANGTINLYDKFYATRDDIIEAVWEIPAEYHPRTKDCQIIGSSKSSKFEAIAHAESLIEAFLREHEPS